VMPFCEEQKVIVWYEDACFMSGLLYVSWDTRIFYVEIYTD
jgi:hypothetical protein